MRKGFKVIAVLTIIALLSMLVVIFQNILRLEAETFFSIQRNANTTQPVVKQDKFLLSKAKQLGLDVQGVSLLHKNVVGGDPEIMGFYEVNGDVHTISIKKGLSERDLLSTIAHEYIHFIQQNYLNDEDKQYTESSIRALYEESPEIREHMKAYENCVDDCLTAETLAVSCTEYPRSFFNKAWNDYCDSFVPKRDLFIN
jgi:hypothetical protein